MACKLLEQKVNKNSCLLCFVVVNKLTSTSTNVNTLARQISLNTNFSGKTRKVEKHGQDHKADVHPRENVEFAFENH